MRLLPAPEDVRSAREMQDRFFPQRFPSVTGVDYYGDSRRARDLGGDFYHLECLPGGELSVVVGETLGEGIEAALLMSTILAFLYGAAGRFGHNLAAEIEELNRMVCAGRRKAFSRPCSYAVVDARGRRMRYASAGHEQPLIVKRSTGKAQRLAHTGTVLGLTTRSGYGCRTVDLDSGDTLAVFSDGVTDTRNDDNVARILRTWGDARSVELVAAILDSAGQSANLSAPSDDRTVVVLRLCGSEPPRLRAMALEMAGPAA